MSKLYRGLQFTMQIAMIAVGSWVAYFHHRDMAFGTFVRILLPFAILVTVFGYLAKWAEEKR